MEKSRLVGTNKSRIDPHSKTLSQASRQGNGNASYMALDVENDGSREGDNGSERPDDDRRAQCLARLLSLYGKSIVFGGIDGLLLALSICCASFGAALSFDALLTLGLSCVVAGALKMGMDEFLSSKAHVEFVKAEKRRGLWEFKNYREQELKDMSKRFEEKGMSKADSELIVAKMSLYETLFVNLKVSEDLGLQLPEDKDDALILDMLIMVLSFFFFGAIPFALSYIAQVSLGLQGDSECNDASGLIVTLNLVVLFLVGSLKNTFGSVSWFRAGSETLGLGLICGGAAYFVSGSIANHISLK